MTEAERGTLRARIEEIVTREAAGPEGLPITGVEVEFRDNHAGEPSIFVTVGMPRRSIPARIAHFLTYASGVLVKETHTSDGFLFPYVKSLTEEDEAA